MLLATITFFQREVYKNLSGIFAITTINSHWHSMVLLKITPWKQLLTCMFHSTLWQRGPRPRHFPVFWWNSFFISSTCERLVLKFWRPAFMSSVFPWGNCFFERVILMFSSVFRLSSRYIKLLKSWRIWVFECLVFCTKKKTSSGYKYWLIDYIVRHSVET